jgi:hypothetical protein
MIQQELLLQISKYFSRFSEQVKILNANGEFSINIHAENVLIKILNTIFESDFKNVNYSEGKNYDSIDLRDEYSKYSIQITATSSIKKIKDTLNTYIENQHYKKYEKLYILMLTGRQEKYRQESINKVTNDLYFFNQGTDVIDFTSLYLKLNEHNDLAKILVVKELLESQFSDSIEKSQLIEIKSYQDLCKTINPYLMKNGSTFKMFGPNSSSDSKEELRWDLSLWYKSRREIILPNNKLVQSLIEKNKNLLPSEHLLVFEKYIAHCYAFEKHCADSNFDYRQFLFPKEIVEVIKDGL